MPGVGPEGQVPAVDDEAARDRPGAGQLFGEGTRTESIAEQERGPGGTDAPFEHVPATDHVAPQLLGQKFVLLGTERGRAQLGSAGI